MKNITLRLELPNLNVEELKEFADALDFCKARDISYDRDDYFDTPHLEATVDEEKYNEFLNQPK